MCLEKELRKIGSLRPDVCTALLSDNSGGNTRCWMVQTIDLASSDGKSLECILEAVSVSKYFPFVARLMLCTGGDEGICGQAQARLQGHLSGYFEAGTLNVSMHSLHGVADHLLRNDAKSQYR